MASLIEKLSDIVGAVFAAQGLPPDMGRVKVADRPDLAQFQCNGAMAAAKAAKKNPREVAQVIVDALTPALSLKGEGGIFTKIDIAGPGFINLNITDDFLAQHLAETANDDHCGIAPTGTGQTMVLDYGGPNVAKEMHVGHLRSSIIGESLKRIAAFANYKTIGDVHLGNWGTQLGQVISELEMRYPDWVYFDQNFSGDYPMETPITMKDLEEIYPFASKACKEDPARADVARLATLELQQGRKGYRALWRHIMDISIESIKRNYETLDVHFDLWYGESDAHPYIASMVENLKKNGYAVESEGALVVPVARNDDQKEFPPLLLYKSDGAVIYGTTDLATIVQRMKDFAPTKIVYVVDQRQGLHFEQVFRAARMSGIAPEAVELVFAGFGTMNGVDGKPFKTRSGGILKLEDLIAMGLEKARARLAEAELAKDFSDAEKEDIAHKVAIAALKFADLQNQRQSDYIFDIDRMTAFEGKTGPYLLYQAVRIKSLLRKAAYDGARSEIVLHDQDRALALLLTELPEAFAASLNNYAPHHLCEYAHKLAQQFSSFYNSCHILSETDEALKQSRLALCAMTLRQLETVLGLLGISIPERM